MRFCGFSVEGNKPDASTICRFRNRSVKANTLNHLLALLNEQLSRRDLKIAQGKYVSCDATLIASARRPRKRLQACSEASDQALLPATEDAQCAQADDKADSTHQVVYSDDGDASWKQKGQQSVYGYAGYVTTDDEGLVEAVSTRSASDSEMTVFPEIMEQAKMTRGKTRLYDKGVSSEANREALKKQGLRDGIMRQKPKGKPMSHWNRLRNKATGRRRFVTERTFGTLKRVYGLHRTLSGAGESERRDLTQIPGLQSQACVWKMGTTDPALPSG